MKQVAKVTTVRDLSENNKRINVDILKD